MAVAAGAIGAAMGEAAANTNADAVLARITAEMRPRLRIYVGAAPGVGKTYAMLREAHALRARGLDVVVGFIETYGRSDTDAQLTDLEVVP
jgi:two-component system sensor histidine kinase KdpD